MKQKYTNRSKIVWQVNNFTLETISKHSKENPVKSEKVETRLRFNTIHFELYPEDGDLKFRIADALRSYSIALEEDYVQKDDELSLKIIADFQNGEDRNVTFTKKFKEIIDYKFNGCFSLLKIEDIPRNRSYFEEYPKTLRLYIDLEYSRFDEKREIGDDQYYANTVVDKVGELFNNSIFSDLKITCSDGTEFPAHRFIIALRSPVFKAMFATEMVERKNSTITVDDIDGETMKHTLLFVYKGLDDEDLPQLENELASKLIYAADKYGLPALRAICAINLNNNIALENAISTLLIAEKFDEKDLKNECLHFIAVNFAELQDMDDWKLLDTALMTEIMKVMKGMEGKSIAFVNIL